MEEIFKRYVAVQYSGLYNMITEAHKAMAFGEITYKDYCYIIENYGDLREKYPNAWEEGKKIGEKMANEIYGQN